MQHNATQLKAQTIFQQLKVKACQQKTKPVTKKKKALEEPPHPTLDPIVMVIVWPSSLQCQLFYSPTEVGCTPTHVPPKLWVQLGISPIMPHSIQVFFKFFSHSLHYIKFITPMVLIQLKLLMVTPHKSSHLLVSVQRKCAPV